MIETLFPLGVSHYLLGGLLVGIGIAIPFLLCGLVAGASTIFTSTWSYVIRWPYFQNEKFLRVRIQRLVLAAGMVTGGVIYLVFFNDGELLVTELSLWRLFLGGVLVGIGTKMSRGCTSGHGICGNASLEKTSMLATITFLLTGILVATLTSFIF